MVKEKAHASDSHETSSADEVFSIFIFKTKPSALKAAETYLKNRKWTVGSASGMREVLAYIIQKKPQYVMVAADHTNRKVKILPRLIVQAFPVKVIAFAEGSSTTSLNALREMNQPYSLFPPVSGPAIERLIRKMRKDEKDEAERVAELAKNGGLNPDGTPKLDTEQGTIRLKGEKSSASDMQNSFEQARAALAELAKGGDDDDPSGNAYNPDHTGQAESSSGSYLARGSTDPKGPSITQQGHGPGTAHQAQQDGHGPGTAFSAQQQGPTATGYDARQQGPQDGANSATQTGPDGKPLASTQQGNSGLGSRPLLDEDGNPFDPESSDWEGLREKPAPRGFEDADTNTSEPQGSSAEGKKAKRNQKTLYVKGQKKTLTQNDSLVIRGAVEAMDSSTVHIVGEENSPQAVQKLESSSNIYCITIESPRFSGYLVAALGKNRKMDEGFVSMVKQRLFSFLKANGESANEENPMDIKIKEVAFEDWAIQQAEFLRKSVHQGEEIAMAFFPNKNVSLQLEESASDKMMKMSIDELKEDVALEFDLYMYMPENDKYLLYTPQGRPLAGNQKGRLKDKGMTHMHLRKESVGDVKKYRAQNFLNAKIEAFKKKNVKT
jgi:hypothetical protein